MVVIEKVTVFATASVIVSQYNIDTEEGIVSVKKEDEDWTKEEGGRRISYILQLLSSLLYPPLKFFPTPVLVGISGLPCRS